MGHRRNVGGKRSRCLGNRPAERARGQQERIRREGLLRFCCRFVAFSGCFPGQTRYTIEFDVVTTREEREVALGSRSGFSSPRNLSTRMRQSVAEFSVGAPPRSLGSWVG